MTDPEATAECVKVAVRCRPMNKKEIDRGKYWDLLAEATVFRSQIMNVVLAEI